ncbi:MAG: 5-formyltetrahydrofolate cyclo-ligase [Telluria sp.]
MRRDIAARRRALDPVAKAEMDARIGAKLVQWWRSHRAPTVGVYWPLRGEPDLSAAFAELAQEGAQLVLPVVAARDAPLAFAAWEPGEAMLRDEMGVAVPAHLRMAERPLALVVPCLGFNAHGYRLGYGGGYYDRTLEKTPRPLTAGVAYRFGLVVFPTAAHDVPLDCILTD